MIGNITHSAIPTQNLTNGTTYTGTTSWAGYTYQSNINYVAGLLENTNIGINHNLSVGVNGVNSSDGLVAVIDVKVTGKPPSKSYASVYFSLFLFCVLKLSLLEWHSRFHPPYGSFWPFTLLQSFFLHDGALVQPNCWNLGYPSELWAADI